MAVNKNDAGTWDFECERQGQCGNLGEGTPFRSTNWSTKALAEKRGEQHENEHKTGEPMQALHEFENENGVGK